LLKCENGDCKRPATEKAGITRMNNTRWGYFCEKCAKKIRRRESKRPF